MKSAIQSPSFFIGKEEKNLISFGSGQPDLPPPENIYSILADYKDFKYGPIQGQEKLRHSLTKQYPQSEANNFIITNGASEGLDLAFRYIGIRGKRILLPRPYYYSYPFNARFTGLEAKYYNLVDGKIDLNQFKKDLEGVDAVLINSPSNPTGMIQEVDVLKEIEEWTAERGTYVISDEVYKDLIYDRDNYLIKGKHVITINSFSKTYAMCGFRIGYLYSPDPEIIQSCIDIKTHTSMNTNILAQEMAYLATRTPASHLEEQALVWKERRDLIYNGLRDMGLRLWRPEGAFYVFPQVRDSSAAVSDLYYDYDIITYDGEWFGSPGRIRFSYALDVDKITKGLDRINLICPKGKTS